MHIEEGDDAVDINLVVDAGLRRGLAVIHLQAHRAAPALQDDSPHLAKGVLEAAPRRPRARRARPGGRGAGDPAHAPGRDRGVAGRRDAPGLATAQPSEVAWASASRSWSARSCWCWRPAPPCARLSGAKPPDRPAQRGRDGRWPAEVTGHRLAGFAVPPSVARNSSCAEIRPWQRSPACSPGTWGHAIGRYSVGVLRQRPADLRGDADEDSERPQLLAVATGRSKPASFPSPPSASSVAGRT